jgi:hypothetical protein
MPKKAWDVEEGNMVQNIYGISETGVLDFKKYKQNNWNYLKNVLATNQKLKEGNLKGSEKMFPYLL